MSTNKQFEEFEAFLAAEEPKSAEEYYKRGWLSIDEDENFIWAIPDFDQAIKLDPTNAAYYRDRASAHCAIDSYDSALADYNEAIKLGANDADVYWFRGLVYLYKYEFEYAIADFDKAIMIDPKHEDALSARADAYGRTGEYSRGDADAEKADRLRWKRYAKRTR